MNTIPDGKTSGDKARASTSATGEPISGQGTPLVEVSIELAAGMTVEMDRCVGDIPVLEVVTDRARLVITVGAGDVREVGDREVVLAEEFAAAACELRDEL